MIDNAHRVPIALINSEKLFRQGDVAVWTEYTLKE